MTREEAIELVCYGDWINILMLHLGDDDINRLAEAMCIIGNALRPITREQVENVWKGCPECKPRCGLCAHIFEWDKYGKPYVCESCVDFSNFESDQQFCEVCGAPMTDKALEITMKRMEEMRND